MTTHTCDCTVCEGFTFTAPADYIKGTKRSVTIQIHNYAQMLQNPMLRTSMKARGLSAV